MLRERVAIALLALASGVTHCDAERATTKGESEALDFTQTICSAFAPKLTFFAHADPRAIPYLYTLLTDPSVDPVVPRNVLKIVGYVGGAEDARRVEAILGETVGVLDKRRREEMCGAFECLAIMARRGFPEARAALLEAAGYAYWTEGRSWYPEEYIREHPERRYDGAVEAIRALAVFGNEDVSKQVADLLDHAGDDADARSYLSRSLDMEAYRYSADRIRKAEAEKITEADVRTLAEVRAALVRLGRELPVEDAGQGKLSAADVAFLRRIIGEAAAEYRSIAGALREGKTEGVFARLLDDGELLDPRRLSQVRAEYEKDLHREAELLKLLGERDAEPHRFEVVCEQNYSTEEQAPTRAESVRKVERIAVTFRLRGSAEIGAAFFPRRRMDNLTVAEDGTLIVLMKKIGGKWYWNPFNW